MLEEVYAVYEEEFSINWVKCICQNSSMKEQEREEFLQEFEQNQESLVALHYGWYFSEGIDLLGEKLIGAILVGTGLPQLEMRGKFFVLFTQKMGKMDLITPIGILA